MCNEVSPFLYLPKVPPFGSTLTEVFMRATSAERITLHFVIFII